MATIWFHDSTETSRKLRFGVLMPALLRRMSMCPCWRWIAAGLCVMYFMVTLAAPLTLLVVGSIMRLYGFFNVANPYTVVHWQELFADPAFLSGARNSLVVAAGASVVTMVLYSMLAYALTRYRSAALRLVDTFVWAPWAVPGVLMSLALLWLFLATPLRTALAEPARVSTRPIGCGTGGVPVCAYWLGVAEPESSSTKFADKSAPSGEARSGCFSCRK